MSGGSYDYLCYKEPDDLMGGKNATELEEMINRLAELGYAEDAARESMDLRAEIRRADVRISALLTRLSPIWRAIEWWDSGDWSEGQVKHQLAKWRGVECEEPDCSTCRYEAKEATS